MKENKRTSRDEPRAVALVDSMSYICTGEASARGKVRNLFNHVTVADGGRWGFVPLNTTYTVAFEWSTAT